MVLHKVRVCVKLLIYPSHGERERLVMKNNNSTDRRIFARIPITLPIRFLNSRRDEEYEGQTVDISANGVGLLTKERLTPRALLELWVELPDNRGPFYTRGEVIWSRFLADKGEQRTGIRLSKAELIGLAPILWK